MGFNPLEEKGTPIEQQIHSWSDLNVTPYDKNLVHPYTQTRVILMNGIEVEAVLFKHHFNRHTTDVELKKSLALTRAIEQQHQKMVNWLAPGNASNLEVTIGYEQVAVDLTAWLARTEPDPYVKAALDFALLEDFDHLYRYSNLLELTEGKQANKIVKDLLITDVVHKSFVEVDEAGTEAAAATGVIVGTTSMPLEIIEMNIDSPFIFLIRDIQTEAILFVGRVMNPAE